MELLPEHGSCFVCGKSNPMSVGITWQLEPGNQISAFFEFSEFQQGPPGFVHGGASAAVLDEAMGLAVFQSGFQVVTANLSIDYRKPIPLGKPVRIQAFMSGKTERRIPTVEETTVSEDEWLAYFTPRPANEDAAAHEAAADILGKAPR